MVAHNFWFDPRHLYTVFLPVPPELWIEVSRGIKTEYRLPIHKLRRLDLLKAPTPVVVYRMRQPTVKRGEGDYKLLVLEDAWKEPLGTISEASLEREGFASLAEFRQDWMARSGKRFEPMKMIYAFRLRTFQDSDREKFGLAAIDYLYGDWLDG